MNGPDPQPDSYPESARMSTGLVPIRSAAVVASPMWALTKFFTLAGHGGFFGLVGWSPPVPPPPSPKHPKTSQPSPASIEKHNGPGRVTEQLLSSAEIGRASC